MQSKKAYELVTTGKAGVPGIPARDGFNGFLRDLPGDRLCCHRRLARLSAKLAASVEASGPHDFAVRVQPRSSAVLTIASIASRPASVTIASAPRWDETARLGRCFAAKTNAFIFSIGAGQVICPSGTNEHLTRENPHPTGLRPATLPTRGRDQKAVCRSRIGPPLTL